MQKSCKTCIAAAEKKKTWHIGKKSVHISMDIYITLFVLHGCAGVEGVQEKGLSVRILRGGWSKMKSPKPISSSFRSGEEAGFLVHDTVHQAERFRRTRPFLIGTTRSEEEWFSTRKTAKN
ncbi:hypothetical protein CEXT_688031 [Caerostris extrusa]|uniref:Uncharacterized protein n=1 Tax=Caerostris extrusa TaxID=172846 RepID=A0AAV4QT42_CAEEX|nr:hypothetical protein CEXT_688031 [Caerostris extrusa]